MQGFEMGIGECMAVKSKMGLLVKDFIARSNVTTRDADVMHDGFKLVTSKLMSRVYTRRSAHPSLKECMTVGRMADMSLDDVGYLMYADTTEQFKTDQCIFYEHNFHDASILSTIHKKTKEDPYLYFGIKYKRLSIPSSGLSEVRDTVFFEYSGTTHDAIGHRVFYVVRDSEPLHKVPSTPGVIRLHFRGLFLYTELEDGTIEYVSRSFMNPHGMMPAWMCNRQLVRYASIIETLPIAFQYKKFLAKVKHNPINRPRVYMSKTCHACNSKMTAITFKALYNCAYCGEVICAKCVVPVPRAIKSSSSSGCVKEEFCKRCFIESQASRGSLSSANRGSGEYIKNSDLEGSNVTSTTQDELFESYITTCNSIVKQPNPAKETEFTLSVSHPKEFIEVNAAMTQLQQSIEQQKALVSQMQQRLGTRTANP